MVRSKRRPRRNPVADVMEIERAQNALYYSGGDERAAFQHLTAEGMDTETAHFAIQAAKVTMRPWRPNPAWQGLSKGRSPSDFDPIQLAIGTKVEMEHTGAAPGAAPVAQHIAMDHLTEDTDYYKKLSEMEHGALGPQMPIAGGSCGCPETRQNPLPNPLPAFTPFTHENPAHRGPSRNAKPDAHGRHPKYKHLVMFEIEPHHGSYILTAAHHPGDALISEDDARHMFGKDFDAGYGYLTDEYLDNLQTRETRRNPMSAPAPFASSFTPFAPLPNPAAPTMLEKGYVFQLACRQPDGSEKAYQFKRWSHIMLHDPSGRDWPRCEVLMFKGQLTPKDSQVQRPTDPAKAYFGAVPIFEQDFKIPSKNMEGWTEVGPCTEIYYDRVGQTEDPFHHGFDQKALPMLYKATIDRRTYWRLTLGPGCTINERGYVWP